MRRKHLGGAEEREREEEKGERKKKARGREGGLSEEALGKG